MGRARGELAALIRQFVIENFDSLAEREGCLFIIRAGDVADRMELDNRMPSICGVLKSPLFLEEAGLTLECRTGPKAGRRPRFFYKRSGPMQIVPSGADSSTDGTGEQVEADLETEIRRQVIENLDELAPLRRIIRAGEVVDSMGLKGRMAEVCSALSSRRFQEEARLAMKDAVFQYVPAPERAAPGLSGTSDFVAGVARTASIEAERAFGDRPGEPAAGAADTGLDLPPDHDPTGPATDCGEPSGPAACDSGVEPATDATDSAEDRPAVVLCLVSCVGTKRQFPALAKSLYISDWFIKARRVVEMEGWRWFVLSAKHGLLDPEEPIEPYEKTLDTMSAAERRSWASEVWKVLEPHLAEVRSVVFFAGRKYREHLESRLRDHGLDVQVPMEGLSRGDQLAWLKRRIDGR